jgi:toxin ParE1/3/4
MVNYRISEQARRDLQRIYRRGILAFGEDQADKYFDALFRRFDELAAQPQRYQAVDDIRPGYRRSVCGVDSVYFRIVNGSVEIMRILGHQDVHQELI